jgi:hypothetical protein
MRTAYVVGAAIVLLAASGCANRDGTVPLGARFNQTNLDCSSLTPTERLWTTPRSGCVDVPDTH